MKRVSVKSFEMALVYQRGEFVSVLGPGRHWLTDFTGRVFVEILSTRDGWLIRDDLDLLHRSGKLNEAATFIDLADNERALVWFDGRFEAILGAGLYAVWKGFKTVEVERFDAREARVECSDLASVMAASEAGHYLETRTVSDGHVGLVWLDGQFEGFLDAGLYAFWRKPRQVRVDVFDLTKARFEDVRLDAILAHSEAAQRLKDVWVVEGEVGMVWVDGRFEGFLGPGHYAWWTHVRQVEVQVVEADAKQVHFENVQALLDAKEAPFFLKSLTVCEGQAGLVYVEGELSEVVGPGQYVYWSVGKAVTFSVVEMRESVLDVTGQEIMTQDKVTLRVNAALTYRVVDARKATCEVSDFTQTLYRDAQLALREVIGTRELDSLLTEKDVASQELRDSVQLRATDFGVSVVSLGIKDLILPGEMKELLNKVTEARKAAEAAVITRREETSAVRSQLNSAKLMEGNPTLMRLRELELVEKVAENSTLNLVLGEQGLTDRIVNLI
jgi:regulator of protease activity HflC (stomatin/prohibitin superfamily)